MAPRQCPLCLKIINKNSSSPQKADQIHYFLFQKIEISNKYDHNYICKCCINNFTSGSIVLPTTLPLENHSGLFATKQFAKNDCVLPNFGETRLKLLTSEEAEHSQSQYLFSLRNGIVGDPKPFKSKVGFINCCVPNTWAYAANVKVFVNFETCTIGVQAIKDINIGDEIFFTYGNKYWNRQAKSKNAEKRKSKVEKGKNESEKDVNKKKSKKIGKVEERIPKKLTASDVAEWNSIKKYLNNAQAHLFLSKKSNRTRTSASKIDYGAEEESILPVEEQREMIRNFNKNYLLGNINTMISNEVDYEWRYKNN